MQQAKRLALVIAAFFLPLGGSHASASDASLNQLSWLGGCWNLESAEPGSGEQWMPPAGASMMGVSRVVYQGKTVAFEFMRITQDADGSIAFYAQPSGKPPTRFAAHRINDREVVFEDTGHDFPQRVSYRLASPTQLEASIEGMRGGSPKRIDFPMTRVSCDSQLIPAASKP